ncbi:MAG: hypothetical protein DELT_01156 [Desulfovibrio sp.]
MNRKKNDKNPVRLIRNSTAEFLIFTGQVGEQSIEARYEDETVWLSQKLMAVLFAVSVPTINEHLKSIYKSEELQRDRTIRNFRIVQAECNQRHLTNFGQLSLKSATPKELPLNIVDNGKPAVGSLSLLGVFYFFTLTFHA